MTNLLLQEGAAVTAVTRATQPPRGARVVNGDLFRPQWLEAASESVEAILVSPRATGPGLDELLKLAVRQGVQRAVLLSATTVEYPAGEARFAAQFKAAENLVTSSGLEWTVLRLADFAANALAWAPQIKAGDVVRGAYGEAATSLIHENDIKASPTADHHNHCPCRSPRMPRSGNSTSAGTHVRAASSTNTTTLPDQRG